MYLEDAKYFHQLLLNKSDNIQCKLLINLDAVRCEDAWAKRYPEMLKMFYINNA
ncbi:hypothetical protein C942_02647 [Photobacterium marinum]|uniref:Uncharacterized protein n=1 Tax=Photobacterium marinum TaxID=1056511 RepID=L8JI13_9GAMM|nr:hypothetical protein C942_02647 [Photobacterium marinum]